MISGWFPEGKCMDFFLLNFVMLTEVIPAAAVGIQARRSPMPSLEA